MFQQKSLVILSCTQAYGNNLDVHFVANYEEIFMRKGYECDYAFDSKQNFHSY